MFRKWHEARSEEGFTLIELLVVVIIIGILAAIAIPAFLNQRERAWQAELTSTARNVALEVEAAATAANGDYSGQNLTTVDGFATRIQGAADTPVDFIWVVSSTTGFSMCAEHASIAAGSIQYHSLSGGLADYSTADCPAAPVAPVSP